MEKITVKIDNKNYDLKITGRSLSQIENLVKKLNQEISYLKEKLNGKSFSFENLLIMVCLKIMEEKEVSSKSIEKVDFQLQNILEILSNE